MSLSPSPATLKPRALAELTKAFEEARGELSCDWVKNGDLDLASLRDDPALDLVLRRYCRAEPEPVHDDDWRWRETVQPYREHEAAKRLRGYPARPWGDPERRATSWAVVAWLLLDLTGVLVLRAPGAWLPAVALVVLSVFAITRCAFAWNEARRSEVGWRDTTTEGGRS